MKVAVAGYGSRGDVEPPAAVARELLRRGHDVCLAFPPYLLDFIESAGLSAVPFGPDPPGVGHRDCSGNSLTQTPVNAMVDVVRQLSQAWSEWGAGLTTLAQGADLLVTGKGEQGLAANTAEYYGIPLATLHFFPCGQSRPGGVIGRLTKDAEDAQRQALGLPSTPGSAVRETLEIQAYDELCFPGLAAAWAKDSARRPFVGALSLELPTNADAEVLSWIASGTPPIYFGFGSNARVPHPTAAVAMISAACARLGERALICSGASDFTGVPRFDHVKIVDAVSHAAVFPSCRAIVHQGGAGTTAAGMRAGIPTLILWFELEDQPIWAAAVERLEVGLGRQFSATTEESLVADLRAILAPPYATHAREVAGQMTTTAESVAKAAALLEGMGFRR